MCSLRAGEVVAPRSCRSLHCGRDDMTFLGGWHCFLEMDGARCTLVVFGLAQVVFTAPHRNVCTTNK